MAKGEPMPDVWRRSRDHFTRLTELIRQELDDETQLVEERWKTWSKQRLLLAGVSLFDLKRPQGRFFGEDIIVFEAQDGGVCPNIDFSTAISSSSLVLALGEKKSLRAWCSTGAPRVFELSLASGPGTSEKGVGVSTEGRTV